MHDIDSPEVRASRATLHDVARLSGVSTATVARVLAESALVRPETRARVKNAVKQLHFRTNEMARDLRRGTPSSAIGLVVNGFDNAYYARVALGAERALRHAGYYLVLGATDEDPAQEPAVASAMLQRQVSALLIVSGTRDHQYLARELAFGTPVIFVGRPPANLEADCVLVDDRAGVREATSALLDAGHRRIAAIRGVSDAYPSQERLAGFFEAHLQAGVKPVSEFIVGDKVTAQAAMLAAESLMSAEDPPTAFLGLNHGVSVGIMNALLRTGQKTPFVGMDEFELADVLSISVIDRSPEELGRQAALAAIKRIKNPELPVSTVSLTPKLIVRGRF